MNAELIMQQTNDFGRVLAAHQQLLVEAVHKCAVKFPVVASEVVDLLLNCGA